MNPNTHETTPSYSPYRTSHYNRHRDTISCCRQAKGMKRKQDSVLPSDSQYKRQKHDQHRRDICNAPFSPACTPTATSHSASNGSRVHSFNPRVVFEPKPRLYSAPSRRRSDVWTSSDFEYDTHENYTLPLLRRSRSLPELSDLRSLPLVACLSKQNIRVMDKNFTQPLTPIKSSASSNSLSQTSPSKSSYSILNPTQSAERLQWVNIFNEETGRRVLDLRPFFRDHVREIVLGQRKSSMKPESVQRFADVKLQMDGRNEATIVARLMPFLVKEDRTVSRTGEDELGLDDLAPYSDKASASVMSRNFETDGLDWNICAPFSTNSVPIPDRLSHPSQSIAELGVKNPIPDITYGFRRTAFTFDQMRLMSEHGLELGKDIASPFFVVEWKAWQGTLIEAQLQIRRAGAAMVWERRRAIDAVRVAREGRTLQAGDGSRVIDDLDPGVGSSTLGGTTSSTPTPAPSNDESYDRDLNAIAFSCIITPQIVFFYVHWAEDFPIVTARAVPNPSSSNTPTNANPMPPLSSPPIAAKPPPPEYHVALIEKFYLDVNQLSCIRQSMHNILDWGLEHRLKVVKREADALVQAQDQERHETMRGSNGAGKREGKRRRL